MIFYIIFKLQRKIVYCLNRKVNNKSVYQFRLTIMG